MNTKKAFTLAEVLITLGIIGVVAALTIPTLMQRTQDREAISALKKFYSTLSSAYNLAVNESGPPSGTWVNTDTLMTDTLMEHFHVAKDCRDGDCDAHEMYYLSGAKFLSSKSKNYVILSDGTIFHYLLESATCSNAAMRCGLIATDINGMKKPNIVGKDIFLFSITNSKVLPFGVASGEGIGTGETFEKTCAKDGSTVNGLGCAAWVIYNENMDYTKCDGLSWTGKTKCN